MLILLCELQNRLANFLIHSKNEPQDFGQVVASAGLSHSRAHWFCALGPPSSGLSHVQWVEYVGMALSRVLDSPLG